LIAKLRIKC